jgi:hypothetical protein
MEVSTEAPACIIAHLETHQEPKASSPKCLKEPSYVKILKDLCTQARKSRNHFSKKILPEENEVLMGRHSRAGALIFPIIIQINNASFKQYIISS